MLYLQPPLLRFFENIIFILHPVDVLRETHSAAHRLYSLFLQPMLPAGTPIVHNLLDNGRKQKFPRILVNFSKKVQILWIEWITILLGFPFQFMDVFACKLLKRFHPTLYLVLVELFADASTQFTRRLACLHGMPQIIIILRQNEKCIAHILAPKKRVLVLFISSLGLSLLLDLEKALVV